MIQMVGRCARLREDGCVGVGGSCLRPPDLGGKWDGIGGQDRGSPRGMG